MMRFLVIFFSLLFSQLGFATVKNLEADSFKVIKSTYEQSKIDPKSTLLVFDIDDTLLTMTQPLGSVGWWDWQYHLLKTDKNNPLLFAKDQNELLKISNILFQLVKMTVTDEAVMPFLAEATEKGSNIMGLTARGIDNENATENELRWNHFTLNNALIFDINGLKLKNNKTSQAGGFQCEPLSRYVGYENGIMYLAGQNKGDALKCVLNQSKKKYKTIFFVDDTKANIDAMNSAFEKDAQVTVFNILFTKEHEKEETFLHSEMLQKKAYLEWRNIKNALEANIKDSVF